MKLLLTFFVVPLYVSLLHARLSIKEQILHFLKRITALKPNSLDSYEPSSVS
jgi:flagellar biosynthesis protein FliQ